MSLFKWHTLLLSPTGLLPISRQAYSVPVTLQRTCKSELHPLPFFILKPLLIFHIKTFLIFSANLHSWLKWSLPSLVEVYHLMMNLNPSLLFFLQYYDEAFQVWAVPHVVTVFSSTLPGLQFTTYIMLFFF